jgi:quercetin dioxygenase-like cupin family protein
MMKKLIILIIFIFEFLLAKSQYNSEIQIESLLKTDTTTIGQKIVYPDFSNAQVSILKITIGPGRSTGWHKHEIPVFAYVLSGTLTVELENNKIIEYPANSAFSEVINTLHNGTNKGKDNVVLIAFFAGAKGKPLSMHEE